MMKLGIGLFLKKCLRKCVQFTMIGMPRGAHQTRYYMYEHFSKLTHEVDPSTKVLSISHSTFLCQLLKFQRDQIVEGNYPEVDMLSLPYPDSTFDYVVSDQILEHLRGDPQQAIDESYRVLKPGGVAIHSTCFIMPVHGAPGDYWRFTPDALAFLCRNFSHILDYGGWGNRSVWVLEWLLLRWEPIPHAKWHLLHKLAVHNNPEWPCVTWVVAQK